MVIPKKTCLMYTPVEKIPSSVYDEFLHHIDFQPVQYDGTGVEQYKLETGIPGFIYRMVDNHLTISPVKQPPGQTENSNEDSGTNLACSESDEDNNDFMNEKFVDEKHLPYPVTYNPKTPKSKGIMMMTMHVLWILGLCGLIYVKYLFM